MRGNFTWYRPWVFLVWVSAKCCSHNASSLLSFIAGVEGGSSWTQKRVSNSCNSSVLSATAVWCTVLCWTAELNGPIISQLKIDNYATGSVTLPFMRLGYRSAPKSKPTDWGFQKVESAKFNFSVWLHMSCSHCSDGKIDETWRIISTPLTKTSTASARSAKTSTCHLCSAKTSTTSFYSTKNSTTSLYSAKTSTSSLRSMKSNKRYIIIKE